MKGGMKCLLENLNDERRRCGENFDLLYHLGELWSEFMREIIPTLQVCSKFFWDFAQAFENKFSAFGFTLLSHGGDVWIIG